jgi:class 3 adenylate cyclase/DNA-binding CsgD family transcriptional regulator
MNSQDDVRHVLPSVRVPTLVIHRTGDRSLPVEGSRYLAEHIPGARYVELPGEDHLPFVGDQDAILDEVEQFLTGAGPAPEPDRVLLTVAAAEVVGTAPTAAGPGTPGWRAALEAHGVRVRQELARYGGHQIRATRAGFLATFDGPARAIRCASAVVAAAWGLGLAVRIGVHTGECDVLDGDIGGVAVQLARSVLARAHPGEVLVSGTVTDLVAGSGLAFEPRGTHRFEGVPGEWRLFRAQWGPRPGARFSPAAPGALPSAPAAAASATATRGWRVGRGAAGLTPREQEVAALLTHGLSNRQIAAELVITVATAERHVTNVLNKLGFHSRSQIAAWAAEQGLHRARFG